MGAGHPAGFDGSRPSHKLFLGNRVTDGGAAEAKKLLLAPGGRRSRICDKEKCERVLSRGLLSGSE
jgi:hypothetical protein